MMKLKPNLTKTSILKVSAELFKNQSYSQVSMRDIAKKLNVKAASLYNHIASKDEILETLIFDLVNTFMSSIKTTSEKQISTQSKLDEIIQSHIDIAIKTPNQYAVLNNDWIFLKPEQKNLFLEQRQHYENTLKSIVQKGIDNQELKACHPEVIIYMMLSSLRTLHLWYERKAINRDDLKAEIPKLILQGIIK